MNRQTWACSDLHGNYQLWKQIQRYIGKKDKLFCLGDCCDRGPDGIRIMQEVLRDKRVVYLAGNHELDLVDTIPNQQFLDKIELERLKDNGAIITIEKFNKLKKKQKETLLKKLNNLPIKHLYVNKKGQKIFLSHSGCNPNEIFELKESHFIWNRNHMKKQKWEWDSDLFIVHGHTPVQLMDNILPEDKNKVAFYCEGHKINIDIGAAFFGTAALINLDTFEVIYLKDDTKLN